MNDEEFYVWEPCEPYEYGAGKASSCAGNKYYELLVEQVDTGEWIGYLFDEDRELRDLSTFDEDSEALEWCEARDMGVNRVLSLVEDVDDMWGD